jgi:rhodanese-related sulfurtransferase
MRYAHVYVVTVLVSFQTAAGSTPSAGQLLDRFAANGDSHSTSFLMKLESDREVVIERIEHPFFKPGTRHEHYSTDCRWDGQRVRLRQLSRLGPGTTKIDLKEQVTFRSMLSDLSERVDYYREEGHPEREAVYYLDAGSPREACFNEVVASAVHWVWGYFPDEDSIRIDGFLRWCPTARVRPQTERIDDSDCYVLEADTRNAKYTIWFDPAHGYNYAQLHYQTPTGTMVVANKSFRKCGEAWVPMEMEWKVQLRQPESDMHYSQKTVVTAFEVNPDHQRLQSFALDDIPDGTRVEYASSKGYRMPGKFEWRRGKPVPCLGENTLVQLNQAVDDMTAATPRRAAIDTGKPSFGTVSANAVLSAPHCGLHCLYLVMKLYGQDPNFAKLVTSDYLDTPKGSTLSAVKKGVEDARLHAEILLRANTRILRSCSNPAILRVRGSETSRDYDHYILFLGMDGSWARICEPPGSVRLASLDELSSRWDGSGVVVASEPIVLAGLVRQEKVHLLLVVSLVILALLLVGRIQKHIAWPEVLSAPVGKSAVFVAESAGLVMAALVIGLLFHSVAMGGFLRYPDGVLSTQRAHASDFIPRIRLETAKRLHEEGVFFVDARSKRDFEAEHVEGAINIPVDANDAVRRQATRNISPGNPIVVYCQSNACQFADTIGGQLRLDGFSSVSILRGGWIEWSTGETVRVPKSHENSGKWRMNSDGTASPI